MINIILIIFPIKDKLEFTKYIRNNVKIFYVGNNNNLTNINFNNINKIGIMWNNTGNSKLPKLGKTKKNNYKFYNNFIIDLLEKISFSDNFIDDKLKKKTLDLISCNLNSYEFINETNILKEKYNINIRYSIKIQPNNLLSYNEEEWIMESDNISIKNEYFTEELNWLHRLNYKKYTQESMNKFFNSFNIEYKVSEIEQIEIDSAKYVNSTYGTISYNGIEELINILNIDDNDIFYDLGSGNGNVVTHFYLKTPVKKSIGIEYLKNRHYIGLFNLLEISKEYNISNNINLINDNIYNYNFMDATIIFTTSCCFHNELNKYILTEIKKNKKLKYFISNMIFNSTEFNKLGEIYLETSWSDNIKYSIYTHSNVNEVLK